MCSSKTKLTIRPNASVDMELVFTPTEVASYEFECPILVNRQLFRESQNSSPTGFQQQYESTGDHSNQSPAPSEFMGMGASRRSSRYMPSLAPKRKITAIALRHALDISDLRLDFRIPITYLETLKDGGFYEAKSIFLTNRSHRPVKWCMDMSKANKVLEEGLVFKITNGQMAPFITNGPGAGPEGEIAPEETYELKVLFCPSKPGVYTCTLPIVVNNNFDRPYYYIGEFVSFSKSFVRDDL